MAGSLLVFFTVLGYGAVHSLLASARVKNAARTRWGPLADRLYRVFFNMAAVITLIPLLAVLAVNIGPVLAVVPWPWAAVVEAGQIASVLLLLASFLQSDPAHFLGLRQMGRDDAVTHLVTTGAYGIVRHPMYTAGLLVLWCFPIVTSGTLAFDLGITLYVLAGSELEERRLIAQFGEEYIRYRSKVAKLIPYLY